jgi:tetratricopeptide (TPR) repeat protein
MRAKAIFLPGMLALLTAWPLSTLAQNRQHQADAAGPEVPLYDNLGDHHYAVTTEVPEAQAYFDQGLRLYYAFNHAEAIRAFREAQRLDPSCAMCWWGESLAWGPNINLPMDESAGLAAYAALQGALERQAGASERERALIGALAVRYVPLPPEDRAALDEAYAHAMGRVARSWPDDDDAVVLYGEALMDLRPWDYWTADGQPQPGIETALAGFERVIERNPDHPGACHFYIHAVEKLYPERAVPCAERLAGLMPGAGHIVHMPGHIYIRVGRYLDALQQNQHAVHADETYIADQRPGATMYTAGYYPHNYDFLAFAASMIGRRADATGSADKVASLIPEELFGSPGMDFLQHWSTRPLQMRVRFGLWDEILATPAPPASRPHALALWHYARGRALAGTGDLAGANAQLDALRQLADSPELADVRMEFNASQDLLAVATHVLAGWNAAAAGNYDAAVAELETAVRLEDSLLYGEPPEWSVPTRQDLGAILLLAGRPGDAERVFRADLERFPDNGWSLNGLVAALGQQGRPEEAAAASSAFERIWATADVDPPL